MTVGNNVLAVELHYPTAGENAVEFDAFVAALTPTTSITDNTNCFVYPYPATMGGLIDSPMSAMDYYKTSFSQALRSNLPIAVTMDLTGPMALANGVRLWPSGSPDMNPTGFKWEGSMGTGDWATLIEVTDGYYMSNTYKMFYAIFANQAFKAFRLQITDCASSDIIKVYEVNPLVCNTAPPSSLTFEPASYTHYAYYQNVNIHPTIAFTDCTIQPTLPAGLTLNAATCTVTGKATAASPAATYTMTSTMGGNSISGTFSLEIPQCSGTFVQFLRTYKSLSNVEKFTVTDAASQQVVLSVGANAGQPSSQDWSTVLCLTGARYTVDVSSDGYTYWQMNSFLYVRALLFDDESETVTRVNYDATLGVSSERVINVKWAVAPHSAWEYHMGDVPAGWQTASGWTSAEMGAFPASTNQIQLYKQTFTVDSLEDVAGFTISLRYLYGCVIYLNGVEVFRNGVDGDLSASSIGLNAYTDLLYHQISLPVKTMVIGDQPSVNYLQQGSNVIAVAIVAQTASQTSSVFDCAVRVMGSASLSRVFDYTVTASTTISGNEGAVASHYFGTSMQSSSCDSNFWQMVFDGDRREWISSVTLYLYYQQGIDQPKQFVLKARNNNLEEWTTLKTVTGMTWSLVGEQKKIWLENNKPYNQYRFEDFATGSETSCSWRIGAIDIAVDAAPVAIPELSYSTPIVINKDVEMGEVYPNSEYYFDFAVTPALPAGIVLDTATGKISGTAMAELPATTYSITAKKVGGGSSTATVSLSVEVCTGTKGLITLVARMDDWAAEGSYKLYAGKGTMGEVVTSVSAFKVASGLNYGDFCVPNGLYTLEVFDSYKDGWYNPAGYYLTVDLGEMIIDMGQMPAATASLSTLFSSLIPFQINYSDWKVYNSETAVAANWNALDFDDAAWMTVKAANMGNHMTTTVYARHEVQMPSLEDYAVLNVRVKYTGGLTVYFNGNKVARFNLAEEFEAGTEAQTVHDASVFSKFHVILSTVGAVAGKNVIAFEIHHAGGESAIVFDATGVFGVNECSPVQDSFSAVDATTVSGCTRYELLDLNPTIYGSLANEVGAYLAWTVENLEGSKFNSFALQTNVVSSSVAFSIYGRWEDGEEYTTALEVVGAYTRERQRTAWDMPVGIAGFKQFRYEVDALASTAPSINAVVMQYCKPASSGSCPAVGEYPSVGEGQISPSTCPEGFRGYSYRECVNGQLGDVKNDKCEYKLPARLGYENTNMEFVLNTQVSSGLPTYRNIVEEFYMQDSTPLPAGLSINPTTGEITGMPTTVLTSQGYTVRARNAKGETFVAINIGVRKGECAPEGVFDRTVVGETAVYQCALQGSYVGTQKRACVLGAKDGEWQRATGFCMPVMVIVLIVVVVIVIIAVVVFLIVRGTRSAKATGGVKGKAAKKTVKKVEPKKTKAVKV